MGYFDSPKNRAMWNRELDTLRKERQARKDGVQPQPSAARESAPKLERERVTYDQLLAEERAARQRRFERQRPPPPSRREREKSKQGPSCETNLCPLLAAILLLSTGAAPSARPRKSWFTWANTTAFTATRFRRRGISDQRQKRRAERRDGGV
jgi:hypothetical protein